VPAAYTFAGRANEASRGYSRGVSSTPPSTDPHAGAPRDGETGSDGVCLPVAGFAAWRAANDPAAARGLPAGVADAVVRLSIRTVEHARTADTLGSEREGTGVLIDAGEAPGGGALILTIGYLVIEAQSVLVITRDNRLLPATVLGFDHATGFALLRAAGTMSTPGLRLAEPGGLHGLQPLWFVTHEEAGGAGPVVLVSRRRFVGYWEYMIDGALFTVPGRSDHSGAALVDGTGALLGIASLWVGDALDQGIALPGNMCVPVDLLRPLLLADLIAHGRDTRPARPWLGVYTAEQDDRVVVARVMAGSPAHKVGLREGDVILAVGSDPVDSPAQFYERLWSSGPAGTRVRLRVLRGRLILDALVTSIDRVDFFLPWAVRSEATR